MVKRGVARKETTSRGGKDPGGVAGVTPAAPLTRVAGSRGYPGRRMPIGQGTLTLENIAEKTVLSSGGRNIRDWRSHAAGKPDDPISTPAETTPVQDGRALLILAIVKVEPR